MNKVFKQEYQHIRYRYAYGATENAKEEEKMESNKSNNRVLAAMLIDGIKTVECVFEGSDKRYTYKTILDLKVGDKVVVNAPGNNFKIIDVVKIDNAPKLDINASFSYKWIVQKIDTEQYESLNKAEEKLEAYLDKASYQNMVSVLLDDTSKSLGIANKKLNSKIAKFNEKIKR